MNMTLTKSDFESMAAHIERVFEPRFSGIKQDFDVVHSDIATLKTDVSLLKLDVRDIRTDVKDMKDRIDPFITKIDQYLQKTGEQGQELLVLRAQQNRMRDVLVEKKVASEGELSITG